MSGNEFADRLLEQILAQGAEIELENVVSVEDLGTHRVVRTEEGSTYEGRAVVLATGVVHRMLGLPGEAELVGEGISFCAVCDGDFYAGKDVCVAGGGNSALQEALLLSDICASVTVLQDLLSLTGEQKLRDALAARSNVRVRCGVSIEALVRRDGALKGVTLRDRMTGEASEVPCDGLFVAIGLIPQNDAFSGIAQLDERGYFAADEHCRTRTPGVYVAGDCRAKSVRQLATAIADGACAAMAACRDLD